MRRRRHGAVIVLGARSLEPGGPLVICKPSGKDNLWNKDSFSDGSSD